MMCWVLSNLTNYACFSKKFKTMVYKIKIENLMVFIDMLVFYYCHIIE